MISSHTNLFKIFKFCQEGRYIVKIRTKLLFKVKANKSEMILSFFLIIANRLINFPLLDTKILEYRRVMKQILYFSVNYYKQVQGNMHNTVVLA